MTQAEQLPVILLGAGGNARVLLSILRAHGIVVAGCSALEPPDGVIWPSDIPYLGGAEALQNVDPAMHLLVNGVGSAGAVEARREVFERAQSAGFRFRGLRHATAIVDPTAEIDETALIMAGAIIQSGVRIGPNVLINTGAIIDHDSQIGAHSHVATGARLAGEVAVGEAVHVGAGATIIQGRKIGQGAVIAAGAVVIRPVEPASVYGGVPARPLSRRGG